MRCDGSPDPSNLGEINMYLTLWKEDVKNIDFEIILKEAALLLQVPIPLLLVQLTQSDFHLKLMIYIITPSICYIYS